MARFKSAAAAALLSLIPLITAGAQPEGNSLPHPRIGPHSIKFEHIGLRDGLSQGSVYDIIQDRRGFIWMATQDGLNRYDGSEFKVYKHIPFDTTSLSANYVWGLDEGPDGSIWVGTRGGGLNRLDPISGEVTHYMHDPADSSSLLSTIVFDVFVDREGYVWAATSKGLDRLDPRTNQLVHFKHDPDDPSSLSDPYATAVHEDEDGVIWVGTMNGIGRLDYETGSFTRYFYSADSLSSDDFVGDYTVVDIIELPDMPEWLWLATGSGLVRLKKSTGEYRTYPIPGKEKELLRIELDPHESHVLWATSDGGGLMRFDTATEAFAVFRHDPNASESIVSDEVFGLLVDRSGMMWVGSGIHGVSKFDPLASGFANFTHRPGDSNSILGGSVFGVYVPPLNPDEIWSVHQLGASFLDYALSRINQRTGKVDRYVNVPSDPNSVGSGTIQKILEDRSGTLWISSRGAGLIRFNRGRNDFTRFVPGAGDPTSISSSEVTALCLDRRGRLWIGTIGGGLNRMDPDKPGKFVRIQEDPSDSGSLLGTSISRYDIVEAPDGIIWIGTNKGLNRLDPDTGAITRFPINESDSNAVAGPVLQVYPDRTGAVWIYAIPGDRNLLQRYDPTTGRFTRYGHDSDDAQSFNGIIAVMHESPTLPGTLWIGYQYSGLARVDPSTGEIRHYTEQDGLANNVVYGIAEDAEGNLWLSTNNGLSRFSPTTETFRNFDEDDGLPSREFNQYAAHQSVSGQLVFGSAEGVTAFFPADLKVNSIPPEVVVTDFRLFNEGVRQSEHSVLQEQVGKAGEIHLAYWQRDITLEYVALHFKNPAGNRYAYKLEGFDDDWINAGTRRSATYTNLDPGTYTFHVKAANSDGVWNETGATLALVIAPPFWKTAWFRILGIAVVIGLGIGFYRLRVRQIKERNAQLEEEVRTRTTELRSTLDHLRATQAQLVQTEKMASLGQLTAGIAHEIKNPLNFINNFAALCDELSADLMSQLEQNRTKPVATVAADLEEILTDLRTNAVKIREHGRRADGIVRSMLQHSNGKSGHLESTDVNRMMNEYVNLAYHGMRAQKSDFNVNIDRRLDPEAGMLDVVPQELGRVLINLLNNAFYAVHDRSRVEGDEFVPTVVVATRRKEDELELRIRDNGPGIPDEVRAKIFEPFFTTKPTGDGTGLGLSLSYDIITKMHGGRIFVNSEEGKGAEFVIILPINH